MKYLGSCCSVTKLCLNLCEPVDSGTLAFSVILHHFPGFAQIHICWISNAIQPSHPLSSPSPAFNLSQHHDLFQWDSSLNQVPKVLELKHQSFQWIIQGWFPLGLTGFISLLSRWLSKVFFMPQFKSINSSTLCLLYGSTLTFKHDY